MGRGTKTGLGNFQQFQTYSRISLLLATDKVLFKIAQKNDFSQDGVLIHLKLQKALRACWGLRGA